jgi:hypothetical protein
MFTDENFEIRREFVDEQDYRRTPSLDWVPRAVVLLVAAYVLASVLGWLGTIPKPQPSTRRANEPTQTDGRSPARPIGGERSSNPSVGRSAPTQRGAQEAPENEVVVVEAGAAAPAFQWVCGGVTTVCRLDSNGIALQGFLLRNGAIVASGIRPNLATPAAWGCGVQNGTELICTIQEVRGGATQYFIYDGHVVKEMS